MHSLAEGRMLLGAGLEFTDSPEFQFIPTVPLCSCDVISQLPALPAAVTLHLPFEIGKPKQTPFSLSFHWSQCFITKPAKSLAHLASPALAVIKTEGDNEFIH